MSADNSISPSARQREAPDNGAAVQIPEDLAKRYEVRTIAPVQGGEPRIGLFVPGDRQNPAIEITGERIVARKEDAETVASLIKLAEHNGWDKVDVEGSPEFRRAMWAAGTRVGLTVSGYEPSFAEQERVEAQRREDTLRRERETGRKSSADNSQEVRENVERAVEVAEVGSEVARERATGPAPQSDRAPARESNVPTAPLEQSGRYMVSQWDVRKQAAVVLGYTNSPALAVAHFSGETNSSIKDTQSGKNLATSDWVNDGADERKKLTPELHRLVGLESAAQQVAPMREQSPQVEPEIRASRAEQERRSPRAARSEGQELAELFLNGSAQKQADDPRLANALRAQEAMEQHIAELFKGDAPRIDAANLESRQMISDVLRRGLDVSVREPTPARQIEPVHTPEMER